MPTIINKSYFSRQNDLFIPLAADVPVSYPNQASPDNSAALDNMCIEIERSLLLNALGLEIYNELQEALPITDDSEQKWKDLVDGAEYGGKSWEGLGNEKSLIAYAVYFSFLSGNSDFYTALGVAKPDAENASLKTPAYKLASASQIFIRKYQNGSYPRPNVIECYRGSFVDYYGSEQEVEVSLFQFLRDHKDDYGWDGRFKTYEMQNSFGI